MARRRTAFICQACGAEHPKWGGRCLSCGEWNTLVETVVEPTKPAARRGAPANGQSAPRPLTEVSADRFERIPLPIEEFNRVLGGGIVPGSLVLVGGDPGIGKSTLLLQAAATLAQGGQPVLYVSGEESAHQIRLRADRLRIHTPALYVLSETNLNAVLQHVEALAPRAVVVDSIQTVYAEELTSGPGSVSQVRECAARLLHVAKHRHVPIFLVGHVTKAGAIAGPRVLEHIVDVVLYLEGDRYHAYRLLRSVKNRFGSTNEVGVFEMASEGLVEVANPSEFFLAEYRSGAAGSAVAVTLEGSRPLLVEIQALTTTTPFPQPRRTANGIDANRLHLLLAVLSKRVGLRLHNQDVFVNVVGGLRIGEPAADLAVAVAIASNVHDRAVAPRTAFVGEIGLGGELRAVGRLEQRVAEAAKLGFRRCVVPRASRPFTPPEGVELITCRTVVEALRAAMAAEGKA